jgi:hypothetical protein
MLEHTGPGAHWDRSAPGDRHRPELGPEATDLVRYRFTPDSGAPAQARALTAEALSASPHLDTVMVLVSELVTNAVLHTHQASELRIFERPVRTAAGLPSHVVRVEVRDGDRVVPSSPPVPGAHGGYGLRIVAAMADAWGCIVLDEGKIVWFEVGARDGR